MFASSARRLLQGPLLSTGCAVALVGPEAIHDCPVASRQIESWSRIVASSTKAELTTGADFHSSRHWEMMFVGCLSRGACVMAGNFAEEGTHSCVVAIKRRRPVIDINSSTTDFIMIYESNIFLHVLLTFGTVYRTTLSTLILSTLRQVLDEDVKYDFTADLTGTGDRPVYEICET